MSTEEEHIMIRDSPLRPSQCPARIYTAATLAAHWGCARAQVYAPLSLPQKLDCLMHHISKGIGRAASGRVAVEPSVEWRSRRNTVEQNGLTALAINGAGGMRADRALADRPPEAGQRGLEFGHGSSESRSVSVPAHAAISKLDCASRTECRVENGIWPAEARASGDQVP